MLTGWLEVEMISMLDGLLVGWLVPSPTLCDFASGAVLGACVSTISFPFSAAAVQIQKVAKEGKNEG